MALTSRFGRSAVVSITPHRGHYFRKWWWQATGEEGITQTVQLCTCHVPTEIQDIMADFGATWEKSKVWLQTDLELLSSKSKIIKSWTFNRLSPRLSYFWLTWGFALLVNFSQLFSTVKHPIVYILKKYFFFWTLLLPISPAFEGSALRGG